MTGPLKVFTDSSNKNTFKRGSGSYDLTLWLFMRGVLDFPTRSSNKNCFKKGVLSVNVNAVAVYEGLVWF